MKRSLLAVSAASALVLAGLIACAPPQKDNSGGETKSGVKVSEAKYAADFGGMDGLVGAAKREGELNVIALPPDWANFGPISRVYANLTDGSVISAQMASSRAKAFSPGDAVTVGVEPADVLVVAAGAA
jgi:putative spermidine/putrescine transport system substrate-binding protein